MVKHCSLYKKNPECFCVTCHNPKCVISIGKICFLCSYPNDTDNKIIRSSSCLDYYSWTDKLKKKDLDPAIKYNTYLVF